MIITAIAAMDRRGLIGDGTKMPWHLPRDLKRFRDLTMGRPIIMGRKTLDSIGRPLPGRLNVVLTRAPERVGEGFRAAGSVEEALQVARDSLAVTGGDEAMIVGGGEVYRSTCPLWDRLLLTVVEGSFEGATRFPVDLADLLTWRRTGQEFCEADAKNPHDHHFFRLERARGRSQDGSTFRLAEWLALSPRSSTETRTAPAEASPE